MTLSDKKYLGLFVVISLLAACLSLGPPTTTWQDYLADSLGPEPLRLYYEARGSGDPVIFLHGLGGNIYMWRHLVGPLAADHQLILFDLKGFGKSPKPEDGKYSLFDQAELIYRFIVQQDLHHVTLVGHSYGGAVALLVVLKLAKQSPDRVSRLVLIDSVAYPQKLPFILKMMRTPVLGPLGIYLIPDRFKVRKMLELIYFDRSKITAADVTAYAAPLSRPGGKYAMLQTARQLIPDNINELVTLYSQIEVPTLILWGREDRIIPLEYGRRLKLAIPGAQLSIIARAGHDPHEERPAAVATALRKFLETPEPRKHNF